MSLVDACSFGDIICLKMNLWYDSKFIFLANRFTFDPFLFANSHINCVLQRTKALITLRCGLNVNTVGGSTAGNRANRGVAYVQTIQNIGRNRRKWKKRRRRKNNAFGLSCNSLIATSW